MMYGQLYNNYGCCNGGSTGASGYALILVLFILLAIIGSTWAWGR